jgi:CTP synthase
VVGKYISLQDAYRSIYEALVHGAAANDAELEVVRVDSEEDIEKRYRMDAGALFEEERIDGILIPGGFGNRGIEGKIAAIRYAREKGIPLFGICLGLQTTVIEFARNVCGLENANSTEFNQITPHPVISLLEEQEIIETKGGTMRLGAYPCELREGSRARAIYGGAALVMERHRHRFEVTLKYRETLEKTRTGMQRHQPPDKPCRSHRTPGPPLASLHPVSSRVQVKTGGSHPLFRDFIRASLERRSVG